MGLLLTFGGFTYRFYLQAPCLTPKMTTRLYSPGELVLGALRLLEPRNPSTLRNTMHCLSGAA